MRKNSSKLTSPQATAVWLINNTSLTFKQIADFCDFDEMTIKLIADGVIARGLYPYDPVKNNILTKEEISAREKDGKALTRAKSIYEELGIKVKSNKKHVSMSQKRNRPEAILYLVQHYPELADTQIVKLARSTKSTVESIRNKTYKDYQELVAKDPVVVGLCTQRDLTKQLEIAEKRTSREEKKASKGAKKVRKINVNKVKKTK